MAVVAVMSRESDQTTFLWRKLFDVSATQSDSVKDFKSAANDIVDDVAATITWRADLAYEYAHREIGAVLTLKRGWDSYDAAPPSADAANLARRAVEIMRNDFFAVPHIVASVEGGIAAAFAMNDRFAQVELLNSGTVLTTTFAKNTRPVVGQFNSDEQSLSSAIETVRAFLAG